MLLFYIIDLHELRCSRTGGDAMAESPYKATRTNPRFSFFADAEVSLRDGTGVRGQIAELSSRGCYIDTLEPIPVRTKLRLRICDGMTTCELHGKVLYMHSGGGFEFSAWACCLKRWVLSSTPQSMDGWINLPGVLAKTWERLPSLKSEGRSRKPDNPPLARNGVRGDESASDLRRLADFHLFSVIYAALSCAEMSTFAGYSAPRVHQEFDITILPRTGLARNNWLPRDPPAIGNLQWTFQPPVSFVGGISGIGALRHQCVDELGCVKPQRPRRARNLTSDRKASIWDRLAGK